MEQVSRDNVRPPPEKEEVYMGVAAPRLKKVDEAPTLTEMPKVSDLKNRAFLAIQRQHLLSSNVMTACRHKCQL